ncbi:hypothetical protein [Streptomyces ziwulingensis]|uniref:Uncharacterized protein n=1 Tax=Streptomyces ziwulingensis TaxID=1045501 RepID=A0ABP9BZB6_9ACTN
MPLDEHEGLPARWLMVPAGVEIDLGPAYPPRPCGEVTAGRTPRHPADDDLARHAAVCRHCGARRGADPPSRHRS